MADIKLRIEVNPNGETEFGKNDGIEKLGIIVNKVNETGTNSNVVNTSFKANSSGVFSLPSERVSGINGLSMASDDNSDAYDFIFNELDELDNIDKNQAIIEDEEAPSEFIWGIVPNNKQYSVKLTFTKATALKDIVIYGDTIVGQFPTKAIIDGKKVIYSDDAKWVINMETESDTHTIEFTEWNRANYNACISNIRVTLRYLDLDKGLVDNFNTLSQSTSDPSVIQYGVLANSGAANIRDVDGELQDLIVDGVLPVSQVPIEVYVNGNKIQEHISQDSDYNIIDKSLSIQLTNKLKELERLIYPKRDLTTEISAYDLLCEIFTDLGYSSAEIDNMIFSMIVYGNNQVVSIKTYLQSIIIGYPYLKSDNYINTINKICQMSQLQMICDNNGYIKFVNSRPVVIQDDINNSIKIDKAYQISNLKKSIFLQNKYNKVEVMQDNISINDEFVNLYNSPNIGAFKINSNDKPIYSAEIDNAGLDITYFSKYITDIQPVDMYFQRIKFNIKPEIGFDFDLTKENIIFSISYDYYSRYNNNPPYTSRRIAENNISFPSSETSSNVYIAREVNYIPTPDNTNINELYTMYVYYDIFNKSEISGYLLYYVGFQGRNNEHFGDFIGGINIQVLAKKTLKLTNEKVIYGNGENIFSFPGSEILSNFTKIGTNLLSSQISNNILSDYANGVSIATIDIFCGDLYNSSNVKVKDWSKGEIINVGDIVYFDNDLRADKTQRYWRVTGRDFKYNGAPTLLLELQEIVSIVQNS